jgi:hypothetical protein
MDIEMQKITIEVPRTLLESAKKYSGGGTTQTVREALEHFARIQAFRELRELRGTYKPSISIEEMRSWDD